MPFVTSKYTSLHVAILAQDITLLGRSPSGLAIVFLSSSHLDAMPFVTSKYTSLQGDLPYDKNKTLDSAQDMFVGASMKCVHAFFTIAFYVTAEHVSDLDWSVILSFGSIFQTLGWYALLH